MAWGRGAWGGSARPMGRSAEPSARLNRQGLGQGSRYGPNTAWWALRAYVLLRKHKGVYLIPITPKRGYGLMGYGDGAGLRLVPCS